MNEILKQLATPAIITGLISGLYAYFQKKKEEYREYVYKNKQENFKELVVYVDELVDKGITNPDLEKLLFKISQKINPYGRKINTFGKYQWIKDDGYVWYQIEHIENILASKKNKENKLTSQILQTVFSSFLAFCLLVVVILIFLLPELSVNESDDKKFEIDFIFLLLLIAAVDAEVAYYLCYNSSNVLLVGMVSLILIVGEVILKAIIFGESEIGKVSTIYIEEYRKLQGPKLSKIKNLFHKEKREGDDDQ